MKKHALFVSAALLVASSFAAIVGGCGSDSATPPGGATGTDSGDQVPPGSAPDSSSTSTGQDPDSSTNNPQPDGGTNPGAGAGKVTCGAAECNTTTDVCCTKIGLGDAGLASTAACQPKADSCTGVKSSCDQAADCAGGEVCCVGLNLSSTCTANTCGALTLQLCREAGECKNDGGTCTEYTCQGDRKVMACSKPPGCN